jgi:TatD DNase family protein
LNTNGHGNYVNQKDITPELQGLIDTVSISLNSTDKEQYAELMNVSPELHDEMIDFAKKAKHYSRVVLSVVNIEGVDTEAAHKFAEKLGVEFRLRNYFY